MKSESEPFEEPFQDPDAQNKESMYFGSVIHLYRTRRNLSQADLADRLYVDRNSVANWEGGRSRPPLDVIPRLCDILSVPMDTFFNMPRHERDLSLEEQDAIALYHRLNPHDREVIHAMIASLQEFQQQRLKRRCLTGFVTLWRINLRAGLFPEQSLEKTGKPVFVRRSALTEAATHIAAIEGDAMEPAYEGGSDVYIQQTEEIHPGDIICASVNGHILIRQLLDSSLHAFNPERGDLSLSASLHMTVIGKVLGRIPKQDLPSEKEQELLESLHWEKERSQNIIKRTPG